jgi:hypothetical protein
VRYSTLTFGTALRYHILDCKDLGCPQELKAQHEFGSKRRSCYIIKGYCKVSGCADQTRRAPNNQKDWDTMESLWVEARKQREHTNVNRPQV